MKYSVRPFLSANTDLNAFGVSLLDARICHNFDSLYSHHAWLTFLSFVDVSQQIHEFQPIPQLYILHVSSKLLQIQTSINSLKIMYCILRVLIK